jgi:hypothetical protein
LSSYDTDFQQWLLEQAAALRRRDRNELDWDNLAVEIEGLAARDRREFKQHLEKLLKNLLKFWVHPYALTRHHTWRSPINDARNEIRLILEQSPGVFQGNEHEVIARCYEHARRDAAEELRLSQDRFTSRFSLVVRSDHDSSFLWPGLIIGV